MPKFEAEKVEYDFTIYPRNDGQGMCTGKGAVPEPTDAILEEFGKRQREMQEELGISEPAALQEAMAGVKGPPEALRKFVEKLEAMSEDERKEFTNRIQDRGIKMYADFCQGSPSEGELRQLPPRIKRLFFGYVQEQFTNPNT